MLLGNLAAIAQTNIKRMLAYSTIAQVGFMLLGLTPGVVSGNTLSAGNGYSSSLFYVITDVLTTLGTFGIIMLLSRQGHEAEHLDDFRGLARRSPWFAGVMAIFMVSLAGIPPTVGFYAKLAVLQSLVSTNVARLHLARRRRGRAVAARRLLLPAGRQGDVLRRAGRHASDRGAPRRAGACSRPTAPRCCCSASCRAA